MGKWGWRNSAVVVGTIVLGACSGGSNDASADTPSTTVAATTTVAVEVTSTTVAATTTTTVLPPYSFDGSVPPPPLNNTGDDFEAIYRSIDAYSTWLFAHNPDPSLISEFVSVGTKLHQPYDDDLSALRRQDLRLHNATAEIETIEITDTAERAAILRVSYTPGRDVLVDSGGVVDEHPSPAEVYTVLLTADSGGRWRLSSITNEASEVAL